MPTQSQIEKKLNIDHKLASFMMMMNQCSSAATNAISLLKMQVDHYEPAGFALLEQAVLDCKKQMDLLGGADLLGKLNAIIDKHQDHIERHSIGYQMTQYPDSPHDVNPIVRLIATRNNPEKVNSIKFQLNLFGAPTPIMFGEQKTSVYTCEIAGDSMAHSPGGGIAILLPYEGVMLKVTGRHSVATMTVAESMAIDYADAVMNVLKGPQAEEVHQPRAMGMKR